MEEFNLFQFANPAGEEGYRLTKHMNEHHMELTKWGLDNLYIKPDDVALDIGCGGGNTAKLLCEAVNEVKAIDISKVSVESTIENNAETVASGKLEVLRANASKLPFASCKFDLITAVETVYFWQDIMICFNEIYRTLKQGGTFCMLLETYACEEQHEYNLKLKANIKGFNVYSPEQLEIYLTDAGFKDILIFMRPDKPWICCTATK